MFWVLIILTLENSLTNIIQAHTLVSIKLIVIASVDLT